MLHSKKDGKWVLPGGKVNPMEKEWDAAKRTYKQKTGQQLPFITNGFQKHDYVGYSGQQTRIYYAQTNRTTSNFVPINDFDRMQYIDLNDIVIHGKYPVPIY